jgi:hypothetical protein
MVFGCKLKLGGTFRYFVLSGFSEPSVCPLAASYGVPALGLAGLPDQSLPAAA